MANFVSPLGLQIIGGPTTAEIQKCIEKQNDPANTGLKFTVQKVAYDRVSGQPITMTDGSGNPVTGEVFLIPQVPFPLNARPDQKLYFGHTKGAMTLGGQPIPLAPDTVITGTKDITNLEMSDANSTLTTGIVAATYIEWTYDAAAKNGEIRTFVANDTTVSLLSLKALTGMDHKALLPRPRACCGVITDNPLTFAP